MEAIAMRLPVIKSIKEGDTILNIESGEMRVFDKDIPVKGIWQNTTLFAVTYDIKAGDDIQNGNGDQPITAAEKHWLYNREVKMTGFGKPYFKVLCEISPEAAKFVRNRGKIKVTVEPMYEKMYVSDFEDDNFKPKFKHNEIRVQCSKCEKLSLLPQWLASCP